jgi:hypothetical protein
LLLKFVKLKHLWDTLRGHKLADTKELELLLKESIKLYNKAIAQKGKGETIRTEVLDNGEEIRYSKRTTYNQYTTLAMQWANANTTKVGDVKIFKEMKANDRSGKIKSVSGSFVQYDKLNKQRNAFNSRKSGVDSNETQYRRENSEMVRVASPQTEGRERSERDGNGDSKGGSSNRQGDTVRHSRRIIDSDGVLLTEENEIRAEYLRRTNNDAISKGYLSDGLSSRLGHGYDNSW